MERLLRLSLALIGALFGFVLGLYLAFLCGAHAHAPVFTSAAIVGALCSMGGLSAGRRLTQTTGHRKHLLLVTILCWLIAVVGFVAFVNLVAH